MNPPAATNHVPAPEEDVIRERVAMFTFPILYGAYNEYCGILDANHEKLDDIREKLKQTCKTIQEFNPTSWEDIHGIQEVNKWIEAESHPSMP